MEQTRIMQLLARKLAGEATQQEIEELEVLLAKFPDAIYYDEALNQITFVDPLAEDPNAAFERHKLKHAAEFSDDTVPVQASKKSLVKFYLIAASVLVPVCIGVFFLVNRPKATLIKEIEIVCGQGMRKRIILPDGSRVWLNGNSKLQYDEAMLQKDHRDVKLVGEAFFDVAKDKVHPFIIHTPKISIRVVGTEFNVKAYPGERLTEATLIRGVIELSINSEPQQRILLKPKEKFALKESATDDVSGKADEQHIHSQLVIENIEPVEIGSQNYYQETSWVQNKLIFKDESFNELAPKLEKWYNVRFKMKNAEAGNYHFTGILENETVEQALKSMQAIRPFKFKITANEVEIN